MRYSVDKLLQQAVSPVNLLDAPFCFGFVLARPSQAEVRTGTTGLRSLMGPLCLRQLQALPISPVPFCAHHMPSGWPEASGGGRLPGEGPQFST